MGQRRFFLRGATLCIIVALAAFPQVSTAQKPSELTLAEVMSMALAQGRATEARAKVLAANARLQEARGAAFPKASVMSFVGPSPSIQCLDANCTRTNNTNVNLDLDGVFGGIQLSVVQPLYTFGKIDRAKRAARSAKAAQQHLAGAKDGDIVIECARAYYGLKLGRDLVWMLEDGQEQVQSALESIRTKLEEGNDEVTLQDRLRLETFAAELAVRLADARLVEGTALAAVRALVLDANADVDKAPIEAAGFEASATRDVLRSPEVLAADAAIRGARLFEQYRRAQYWPDVALVAGLNLARAQGAQDPPTVYANDPFNQTTAQLGLVLRWSVDPMTQRALVKQARAQTLGFEATRDAARSKFEFEDAQAKVALKQAEAKLSAAQSGEKAAKGWLASVLQAEAIGTMESKDLVDAYIAFFTMKSHWLKAVYDWNVGVIVARKARGEYAALGARPSPQRFP